MGRDESGVHSADINPRIGAAHPRETAGFQRSLLGALTPSPLMSALWTPGRAGAKARGSCGSARRLRHRSARPTSDRRLCWGLEAMTRRRLRLESRLELACSTRVGIYWPRVVRTARRPHLPKVHPTLVQCSQTTT